jgi:hypothetical protein
VSELRKQNREELYKEYVTDMLKAVVQNTAGGEERVTIQNSYRDLIAETTNEDVESAEAKVEATKQKYLQKFGGG